MSQNVTFESMSPAQVHERWSERQPIDLVDVRSPAEFSEIHATYARNIPLDKLTPQNVLDGRAADAVGPVYVICKSGGRSRTACTQLAAAGVKVVNVEGGTSAWASAGLPVTRGSSGGGSRRPIVMLGLLLTVLFFILGLTVSPYFHVAAAVSWIVLSMLSGGCPLGMCALPRA